MLTFCSAIKKEVSPHTSLAKISKTQLTFNKTTCVSGCKGKQSDDNSLLLNSDAVNQQGPGIHDHITTSLVCRTFLNANASTIIDTTLPRMASPSHTMCSGQHIELHVFQTVGMMMNRDLSRIACTGKDGLSYSHLFAPTLTHVT